MSDAIPNLFWEITDADGDVRLTPFKDPDSLACVRVVEHIWRKVALTQEYRSLRLVRVEVAEVLEDTSSLPHPDDCKCAGTVGL